MKGKKWLGALLALCLMLSMTACGSDAAAVYVQSVKDLSGMGGIAPGDRFAGIVVSENVAQIRKDSDKTVAELLVKEGDDVQEGDVLFSYDLDELQLQLDKKNLEKEQLIASIENFKEQIAELEKQRNRVAEADKLQFTVQIQSTQVDLKEAELNLKTKEAEIAQSETILQNVEVKSPVTGRIQSINESGMDNYGNPTPYITIQQSGAYRVKGMLGELQRGGIMEGSRLRILSRTDETVSWLGTVTLVDYENPSQGSQYDMYYGTSTDEMTAASKYPFYVELEDTEGLILGQHVYLELYAEEGEKTGVSVSSAFICYEEDGSAYVWAESTRGKLEKRPVTLGEYNYMNDTMEVLEGLTEEDYIAFPDGELCQEGAPTTREFTAEDAAEGEVG
ncbi:MAG: efflux RND transporter periplasmic adaptor subunit [Oscillospiraceae bacterium]|nr:efflux RND transporter periplasmic adaptor subunit [Oscillospiraceae bacterium]